MNTLALNDPDSTGVFLFEDHKIARANFLLPDNCRKVSTRAFLIFKVIYACLQQPDLYGEASITVMLSLTDIYLQHRKSASLYVSFCRHNLHDGFQISGILDICVIGLDGL
jgi:hypothetical protein